MQQKNNILAFTLAELLVGITIIGIMALGISQFNFSRLSQKQSIDIEVVKIVNIFEEIRNNALIGKGVGINLDTPNSWRIQVSETGSGQIRSSYELSGWNNYEANWDTPFPFGITQIQCENLDGSLIGTLNGTGEFIFNNNLISFSGTNCNDTTYKIIKIFYGIGSSIKTIRINILTGVIEVD